jgi:hypothetical protein
VVQPKGKDQVADSLSAVAKNLFALSVTLVVEVIHMSILPSVPISTGQISSKFAEEGAQVTQKFKVTKMESASVVFLKE